MSSAVRPSDRTPPRASALPLDAQEPSPGPQPPSPPPAPPRTFAQRKTSVLADRTYQGLTPRGKQLVGQILDHAETSPRQTYYLDKLDLLLRTPDNPPTATATRQQAMLYSGTQAATHAKETGVDTSLEERASLQRARCFEELRGDGGTTYWVDRSDPDHIVVLLKVWIQGDAETCRKVAGMEDAIEKHLGLSNFVVDLQLVSGPGSGVFEVKADSTKWTTARNWVGDEKSLGHELLHLLGLPDEYDYIESHAANRNMKMETRLYWFTQQMGKVPPADAAQGIMGSSRKKPLQRHARAVAQLPEPNATRGGVNLRRCVCPSR